MTTESTATLVFSQAVAEFLTYAERRFSRNTLNIYRYILTRLIEFAPEHIENLKPEHIGDCLADLPDGENLKYYFICIKSFCRFVENSYGLKPVFHNESPTPKIKPQAAKKKRKTKAPDYTNIDPKIQQWFQYIKGRNSKATYPNYKRYISRFANFFSGVKIEDITTEQIEEYLQSLPVKKSTKNTHIIVIKSFYRKMNEWDGLPNPTAKIKKFRVQAYKRRFLTDEEYEKILAVCKPRQRAIIQFFANTGLRSCEFLSITKSNIKGDMLRFVGKGSKERVVPLNEVAKRSIEYILSFARETSTVGDYLGVQRTALCAMCYRLAEWCGIPKFGTHALRRRFANKMRKHADIYIVSRLLGHSSLSTTQVYLNAQPDELKGVTDVLVSKD